jgi:hypothetical protein
MVTGPVKWQGRLFPYGFGLQEIYFKYSHLILYLYYLRKTKTY